MFSIQTLLQRCTLRTIDGHTFLPSFGTIVMVFSVFDVSTMATIARPRKSRCESQYRVNRPTIERDKT